MEYLVQVFSESSSNKGGLEQFLAKMMKCFVLKNPSMTTWVHGIVEGGQQLTLARSHLLATMSEIYPVATYSHENISSFGIFRARRDLVICPLTHSRLNDH